MKSQQLNRIKTVHRAVASIPQIVIDDASKFIPANALQYEWLETNGLGGFSSSTIIGMNTRRYHGLLTAAVYPPNGRYVLLSKLEEDLIIDEQRFSLATNQYAGAIYPQGYQNLIKFELNPFPQWTFQVKGIQLQKTLWMVHGQNTIVVQYQILNPQAFEQTNIRLEVRPLTAFRDYHGLVREYALDGTVHKEQGSFSIKPNADLPELFFVHDATNVQDHGYWYKNFYYAIEDQRGLDNQEDLFNPCVLIYDLKQRANVSLMVSTEPQDLDRLAYLRKKEVARRKTTPRLISKNDDWIDQLVHAADQFIVERGTQKTVIAGYHWFGDWGRDTMISLPGLTLETGRFKDAEGILLEFAKYADQGMLPNRFPEFGEKPEYNTVDATLWFFEAIRRYGVASKKWSFIQKNFYDLLKDVIEWHVKGTRYGIHLDEDGLIACGQLGVQLTWMDAKAQDWVVTPRYGKPVEIQALWYNALCVMTDLADRYHNPKSKQYYSDLAKKAKASFNTIFWNPTQGGLYDVINGVYKDDALRPNQIFAISLPYAILEEQKYKQVLGLVEKELLTPVGLRTLARGHSDYKGVYQGNQVSRDSSYHQGTVWPWLLGPYIDAHFKTNGISPETRVQAQSLLEGLKMHMNIYGLVQVAEIFDGDAPHAPKGCIAQAWSVAELLRVCLEYQL